MTMMMPGGVDYLEARPELMRAGARGLGLLAAGCAASAQVAEASAAVAGSGASVAPPVAGVDGFARAAADALSAQAGRTRALERFARGAEETLVAQAGTFGDQDASLRSMLSGLAGSGWA